PRRARARVGDGRSDGALRIGACVLRAARRGDDRGRDPARRLARDLDDARRADDARHGEAAARPRHASRRAARVGDLARRHDDRRHPRARAGRRARRIAQRRAGSDDPCRRAGERARMSSLCEVVVVGAPAATVADLLAAAAREGGHIVLTGGSTSADAYAIAAERQPDWSRTQLWWGDERCVPADDERSNYGMAKRTLLDRLDAQPAAVHRMRGELGRDAGAEDYDRELGDLARFDLVLLGLGPDGHVASLYPDQPTLDEHERRVLGAEAKLEPYVDRITLTLPMLRAAHAIVFLVAGEDKADAAARAFGGEPSRATPGSLVRAVSGTTTAVLDRAAAARLKVRSTFRR